MTETVATLNFLLGTGGVLLLAASGFLVIDFFFNQRKHFGKLIDTWGLMIAAVLPTGAAIMALIYSEVFGFVPCGLCWSMRIFVFSQAFIMTTAWLRGDKGIAIYGIVLSIPGIVLGLYQHYLQMGGSALVNCPAADGDCAKRILFEYGFMTFPLMGTAMLVFLVLVYLYLLKSRAD